MNWKAGDMAIVCVPHGAYTKYNGEAVCITSSPYYDFDRMLTIVDIEQLAPDAKRVDVACLKPVDDDEYDGNKLTTWDKCPFKPLEIVSC